MEAGSTQARLGRPLTLNEVAAVLGWTEVDKAAHLEARATRPDPDPAVIEQARARLASRAGGR